MLDELKNAIKNVFSKYSTEVKFEDAKTQDGKLIRYESLEAGKTVSVIAEDGSVSNAPEGVYLLEDGTEVSVDVDGKILAVKVPEKMEVADTITEERIALIESSIGEIINFIEGLSAKIDEIISKTSTEMKAEYDAKLAEASKESAAKFKEIDEKVEKLAKASTTPSFAVKQEENKKEKTQQEIIAERLFKEIKINNK